MGFGLLNYRWVFWAGRFLQSAVASGTSNPQLGGPVIRMFHLLPPGVPHIWNDASEPQQRKAELWAINGREFYRKWRLPRHFWVLLYAVNLRHGADGFTSPPKKGVLRIFFARKIRRLRPSLNPRTWVPKATRPPKPLIYIEWEYKMVTKHNKPSANSDLNVSGLLEVNVGYCLLACIRVRYSLFRYIGSCAVLLHKFFVQLLVSTCSQISF